MRRFGKPTFIVPNSFDDTTWWLSRQLLRRRRAQPSDGLIRIGYVAGTRTHQKDFAVAASAVARVLRERANCRLVLFRFPGDDKPIVDLDDYPYLKELEAQIECREGVPFAKVPYEIVRFDINLAPLEVSNPFCEAKSELKWFEAALAEVCTVASPTGPLARAIENGRTGLLATNEESWYAALISLVDDTEMRRKMSRAAYHDAVQRFGPRRVAEEVFMLLEQLKDPRVATRAFELAKLRNQRGISEAPLVPESETMFATDRLLQAEVTIVIPVHNNAQFVEEALESAKVQTLRLIDLIVIDDRSTDNSLEVVLNWAKRHATRFNRMLILRNHINSGLGLTRNAGFDAAETPYIIPFDADNRLLPQCCETCLDVIRDTRAAFVYPRLQRLGFPTHPKNEDPYLPIRFAGGNYIDGMALVAKSAWIEAGGYQHMVVCGSQDSDLWCRLAERGLYGHAVESILALYREHDQSMLHSVMDANQATTRLIEDIGQRHSWPTPSNHDKESASSKYAHWVEAYDSLTETDRATIRRRIATIEEHPRISVIMPTFNASDTFLREAIESVRGQLYPYWELCIDNVDPPSYIGKMLHQVAALDDRVRLTVRKESSSRATTYNDLLRLATGTFVVLSSPEDLFSEKALYWLAEEMNAHSAAELIYSDADLVDSRGQRRDPHFKPDWNPDLLLSQNYIGRLAAYRTERLREIGGFREGTEGAEDWDLVLRMARAVKPAQIRHIPQILYHSRLKSNPTRDSKSPELSNWEAGKAVIEFHLNDLKPSVQVMPAYHGLYHRVRYRVEEPLPLVSIIIPTRDSFGLLSTCINSIRAKTDYPHYDIIVVDNESVDSDTLTYLAHLEESGIARILRYDGPFNWAGMHNASIPPANGELICLLNNDIEVIAPEWLREMTSHALRPGIGAVGAKLLYQDGTVQHGGVILGLGGAAGHAHRLLPGYLPGYQGRAAVVQNFAAVTGACMVFRKLLFDEVGGMDERNLPVAYSDIDFCLRLLEKGYRNVWSPYALLYHYESKSRGYEDTAVKQRRFSGEISSFLRRWGHVVAYDPCYNPNLSLVTADFDFGLAEPPRTLSFII
jgi:glycosyltransferase involved in cell wall biosynthesis